MSLTKEDITQLLDTEDLLQVVTPIFPVAIGTIENMTTNAIRLKPFIDTSVKADDSAPLIKIIPFKEIKYIIILQKPNLKNEKNSITSKKDNTNS